MNPEHIASRYRVIRELGRGGMGVVYVVEHLHTGEQLALKVLHGAGAADPGVIARFKREARVGAQIKSEHVVRVTDADVAPELGGAPFFVMELLEGMDLEKLVSTAGRLSTEVVIALFAQVAKALDKAHGLGIVHRDLKPENIFLHRREEGAPVAKVLDFGISKFLQPAGVDQTGLSATRDGTLMGTPYYMSPEQARGEVETIGPATDVRAMGLVALRLLTGEGYWTARSHADLIVQLLAAPMGKPSERWPFLGENFDAWFARSCARDSSERWSTVAEQCEALRQALAGLDAASGATMAAVNDVLRDGSAARNAPVAEPLAGSSQGGGSENRPRTVTVALPDSFQWDLSPQATPEPARLIGGTTAGTNLARTAPEQRRAPRRWVMVGASAAGVFVVILVAYGILATRPAPSTEPVSISAPASRSVTSVVDIVQRPAVPTTPAEPPVAPAPEPSTPQEPEVAEPRTISTGEPALRTPPPAASQRPPPHGVAKPAPRPVRSPAPKPTQSDDILRP
jgi:serine/threonine-protein kinase